jgi:hypothetical protein
MDQLVIDLINPSAYLIVSRVVRLTLAARRLPSDEDSSRLFRPGLKHESRMPVALVRSGFGRLWAHLLSSLALVTTVTV